VIKEAKKDAFNDNPESGKAIMIVFMVAVADALVYLGAVPICAAFYLDTTDGLRFGVGVSLFSGIGALRTASRPQRTRKKRRRQGGPDWPRLWRMLNSLRPDAILVQGELGLGDAALTATACGALTALAASLGLRANQSRIELTPLFDGGGVRVRLRGMIRVGAGQIIITALRGELTIAKGRITQWTSTLSKASWPTPWRTSAT